MAHSSDLFYALICLMNEKHYRCLYNSILYSGGLTRLNKDDSMSLLLHAALIDDSIAFDILISLGAKVDLHFLNELSEQMSEMNHRLSVRITDRLLSVISNEHSMFNQRDALRNVHYSRKRSKKISSLSGLEFDFRTAGLDDGEFIEIIQLLMDFPEFKQLVKEATATHSFKVKFANKNEVPFGASCDHNLHEIVIHNRSSLPKKILSLIFELCNAANSDLKNIQYSDYPDADSFAYAFELAEFKSVEQYMKICNRLKNNNLLNNFFLSDGACLGKEIPFYSERTFEQYWIDNNAVTGNKPCSHAELYRQGYREWRAAVESIVLEHSVAALTYSYCSVNENAIVEVSHACDKIANNFDKCSY